MEDMEEVDMEDMKEDINIVLQDFARVPVKTMVKMSVRGKRATTQINCYNQNDETNWFCSNFIGDKANCESSDPSWLSICSYDETT